MSNLKLWYKQHMRITPCLGLLFAGMLAGILAGCAVPSPHERTQLADALAAVNGWQAFHIHTNKFVFAGYMPEQRRTDTLPTPTAIDTSATPTTDTLTVYIEGDGLAWISKSQVSPNPTPSEPTALKMALRHRGAAVAYLARPCQYVHGPDARNCSSAYWTDQRFSPEVVVAVNEAVDQLKARTGAHRVTLVGFSGGGAVAALVAGRRTDMRLLITIAGNLDTAAWTRHHGITPLLGSLNPADQWQSLRNVRQIHFVGSDDSVVPEDIIHSYLSRYPVDQRPELRVIQGYSHHCCWDRLEPQLPLK